MKMMIKLLVLLFVVCPANSIGKELDLEIIKQGTLSKDITVESKAINKKEEFAKLWKQMGDTSKPPAIDFNKETVVFIISQNEKADKISIRKVERRPGNLIDIFYSADENKKSLNSRLGISHQPYLIAKLPQTNDIKHEVRIRENYKVLPIPANNGLGEQIKYTNVLSDYQNLEILDYIPLDLGNKWTYKIESDKRNTETTHEIQSISNGWSILNSYFGKQNVAMRIERSGELFISSQSGVKSFYSDSVQKSFVTEEIETPAGKFTDLMIVTIPQNNNFWFRDVYAKDVGLVFHEHISPKGNGTYTLLKAKVRGKEYPG